MLVDVSGVMAVIGMRSFQVIDMKWKDLNIKDQIQYVTAVTLIFSGIVIAFLSFFLNSFNIATGVLIYIAQAFVAGGSIFGVSIYFKTKLGEFKSDTMEEIQKIVQKIVDK